MKAPDKIFVCIPQRLNMPAFKEDSKYVGMAYTDRGNLKSRQIEEYIRKDALLEWLENMVYQHNEDRFDDGFNTAIGQVIDKLQLL